MFNLRSARFRQLSVGIAFASLTFFLLTPVTRGDSLVPAEAPGADMSTLVESPLELAQRPFHSLADFKNWLDELEATLIARGDKRSIFASVYKVTTTAFLEHLGTGFFHDDAWVDRYAVEFGKLYQEAFVNDALGNVDAVPRAWRVAFGASRSDSVSTFRHALLGVHAHINHDLPLAIASTGIDERRPVRRRDHFAANSVLDAAFDEIQTVLAEQYDPALARWDVSFRNLDEVVAGWVFRSWRRRAWRIAVVWNDEQMNVRREFIERILDFGTGRRAEVYRGR